MKFPKIDDEMAIKKKLPQNLPQKLFYTGTLNPLRLGTVKLQFHRVNSIVSNKHQCCYQVTYGNLLTSLKKSEQSLKFFYKVFFLL